jgi:hypothetical protein
MQPDPQHQRPSPEKYPQPKLAPKLKTNSWLVGAAAALLLGAGAFFGGFGPFAPAQTDDLSQQQVQQITAQFAQAIGDFPLVNLNDPEERAQAEAALNLPAPEAAKILQAADAGQLQLAWVTVWDNCAEDGDIVNIASQGYSANVPIMHTPTTVVIPITPAGSLQLTGVVDGGGGITASARTAAGEIPFPPLVPSQTISLPLR